MTENTFRFNNKNQICTLKLTPGDKLVIIRFSLSGYSDFNKAPHLKFKITWDGRNNKPRPFMNYLPVFQKDRSTIYLKDESYRLPDGGEIIIEIINEKSEQKFNIEMTYRIDKWLKWSKQ